jgi:hypothetical protein
MIARPTTNKPAKRGGVAEKSKFALRNSHFTLLDKWLSWLISPDNRIKSWAMKVREKWTVSAAIVSPRPACQINGCFFVISARCIVAHQV